MGVVIDALYNRLKNVNKKIADNNAKIKKLTKEYDSIGTFKTSVSKTGDNISSINSSAKGKLSKLKEYSKDNKSVKCYVAGMEDSLTGIGVNLVCAAVGALEVKCALERNDIWVEIDAIEAHNCALQAVAWAIEKDIAAAELADKLF